MKHFFTNAVYLSISNHSKNEKRYETVYGCHESSSQFGNSVPKRLSAGWLDELITATFDITHQRNLLGNKIVATGNFQVLRLLVLYFFLLITYVYEFEPSIIHFCRSKKCFGPTSLSNFFSCRTILYAAEISRHYSTLKSRFKQHDFLT